MGKNARTMNRRDKRRQRAPCASLSPVAAAHASRTACRIPEPVRKLGGTKLAQPTTVNRRRRCAAYPLQRNLATSLFRCCVSCDVAYGLASAEEIRRGYTDCDACSQAASSL